MLPIHIEEKLKWFKRTEYEVRDAKTSIPLKEKKELGYAEVSCTLSNESVILLKPEDNVLRYLDEGVKGATSSPDNYIFQKNSENDRWNLHIIEFKKTIDTSKIQKSKWQFTMGIYNARAVAAFLGMNIEKVILYSGFRNDKVVPDEKNLSSLRANNNRDSLLIIKEWEKGCCTLNIDNESIIFPHLKIQLDGDGYGEIQI